MNLSVLGKVIQNKEIANNIFDMLIECEGADSFAPGQFVNVLCEGGDALLRRPISICDAYDNILRIIYEVKGKGTALLSEYRIGQTVDMLAPLGNGFTLNKEAENPVIIGGGIGTYPLLMLAKQLNNPQVFLGCRNKSLVTLIEDFEKISTLHISTDDGSYGHCGLITELACEYIQQNGTQIIYSCGPKPMLKAVKAIAMQFNIPCQISMEERMGCGIGACLVCACKTAAENGDYKYSHVCKDGPVFDASEVIFE